MITPLDVLIDELREASRGTFTRPVELILMEAAERLERFQQELVSAHAEMSHLSRLSNAAFRVDL